jgi:acetylornithine deacetylase
LVNEIEKKVLEAIDLDALLDCLCDLIAIESVSGRESPAQERVAGVMRETGMEVDVWEIDLDRLRRLPAYSAEVDRDHALGVVGRWGPREGRSLVLNGHVDVVPAGELERWSRPPWKGTVADGRVHGRVYGRGSADMKGGLCCALFAVRAIRDAGVQLGGPVMIQSVVGEEDGGMGTLAAVERGYTADAAIVMEPTELMIAPAQAGAFNFRITIPGRAAHGALRGEGVDPIDKFVPIYRALQDFERRRNENVTNPLFSDYEIPFALCVGNVRAGIWASTVAETLTLEGRLGVGVDEDSERVRRDLEDVVRDAAHSDPWLREHPPALEWWGAQFEPAAIPADHPIVTTVSESFRSATGRHPVIRGMPYGADMRLLVNEGKTPTVIFGPGDVRRAHAPDEFVSIDDLRDATQTLALSILRFCGTRR